MTFRVEVGDLKPSLRPSLGMERRNSEQESALGLNWSSVLAFTEHMASADSMTVSVSALGTDKMKKTLSPPSRSFCMPDSAVASREDDASKISQRIGSERKKVAGLYFQIRDGSSFVQGSKIPQ